MFQSVLGFRRVLEGFWRVFGGFFLGFLEGFRVSECFRVSEHFGGFVGGFLEGFGGFRKVLGCRSVLGFRRFSEGFRRFWRVSDGFGRFLEGFGWF